MIPIFCQLTEVQPDTGRELSTLHVNLSLVQRFASLPRSEGEPKVTILIFGREDVAFVGESAGWISNLISEVTENIL